MKSPRRSLYKVSGLLLVSGSLVLFCWLWARRGQPESEAITRTTWFALLLAGSALFLALFARDVALRAGRILFRPVDPAAGIATTDQDAMVPAKPRITLPTSKSPRVTIIIAVYNQIDATVKCIWSLLVNVGPDVPYEVIFVNDCSTDDSALVLGTVAGVTVLHNETNQGFLKSCNRAADLAQGEYLCFLNNDTEVLAHWLETMVELVDRDPTVGAVGSKLIYPDHVLQEAGGIIFRNASGWNYGRGRSPYEPEFGYLREVDYCSGASLLVRRDLFRRLGRFSEEFAPAYYEDTDLCFGIRKLGYKVMYQPASQVIHHEGLTSGTDVGSGVKRYQAVNQGKFAAKWKEALEDHFPPGTPLDKCARRLCSKPTILVAEIWVPKRDRDSGSFRLFQIIKIMVDLGYSVLLLPENSAYDSPYTEEFQQMGVFVLHGTADERDMQRRLNQILWMIDIAWVSRPKCGEQFIDILAQNPSVKIIFDTVDLHHVRMKRQDEQTQDGDGETAWQAMRDLEIGLARKSDLTLAITDVEAELLREEGIENVAVVPNVHPEFAGPIPAWSERSGLVFIGCYAHEPNVDAVVWLCKEIMPIVWEKIPEMRVTLLGSRDTEEVRALANDRVAVTGYVPEVDPYFMENRICVAPLRFGAGMKGKIGHSLGLGLPTITTTVGAEGMGLVDGSDILIADDAAAFARAIIRLNEDRALWDKLSQGGLDAMKRFQPPRVRENLEAIFEDLLKNRPSGRRNLTSTHGS